MTKKFMIELSDEAMKALVDHAKKDHRTLKHEAEWLLIQTLKLSSRVSLQPERDNDDPAEPV